MLISEISIKNFKSFGNNEQVLKLNTEHGQLILLAGRNGNGKSSILETVEYLLYGKVKSKTKKWSKLSNLPNRINGELMCKIKFISNNTDILIERGMSPNVLKIHENGVYDERAGKVNIESKIEKYVGVDIETFKSFISMSINDFKNFMSLSNEEKQLLLDKLFNLEVINILNNILKDIAKNNKLKITSLDSEIRTLDESIDSIRASIIKAVEKAKEDIQQEIDTISNEMISRKEEYSKLKEKIDKIKEKESILTNDMDVEKKQYSSTQNDIRNIQREIDLYDSGKCPTCSTDFTSEHFLNLRELLVEKKKVSSDILLEIESNIKSIKEKQIKLKEISEKVTTSFNDINYLLRNYKSQIDKLNIKKLNESNTSFNISEFENTILEFESKKEKTHDNISSCREKELFYKELNKVFGEDGAKKAIISGIIKPINYFISENVRNMALNFEVTLDETFTAEVKSLGVPVEHETLSTGETKLVNIIILVAYLKLIRTKKHINILFLDEVFSSIDLENVNSILSLLKSFSNDYNINIFVVHHAVLNEEMFDRILMVNKDIFSVIEESNINQLLEN